jgi:hypothetical protein
MRDGGGEPQRPGWGLGFRVPGERREYRSSPDKREEFPRLGEPEKPRTRPAGKINGAWGWALLLIPVLLLSSFAFYPSAESAEEESSSDGIEVIIFLLVWFGPYLAGAIAAFRGNRRGITWTFPVTCIFSFFILILPAGGPAGAWIAGAYAFGLAGFAIHFAARKLARGKGSGRGEPRIPFAA